MRDPYRWAMVGLIVVWAVMHVLIWRHDEDRAERCVAVSGRYLRGDGVCIKSDGEIKL